MAKPFYKPREPAPTPAPAPAPTPAPAAAAPALANPDAPFVYFEGAPFYGLINGVGQITLDASRIYGVDASGKAIIDRALVAHLRGNLPAIRSLRAALDGIIQMAEGKPATPPS